MAANMQMGGNGHLMMQQQQSQSQRQLQQIVYNNLISNTPQIQGWQSGMPVGERLGKTMNLYVHFRPFLSISVPSYAPLR
jgi:hypothetical protein